MVDSLLEFLIGVLESQIPWVRKLFSVPLGEGCGISCSGCAIAISELGFLVVVRVIRIGRCGYGVLVGGAVIVGFVICVIGVKSCNWGSWTS